MLYLDHNAATEPHIHTPQHMIMWFYNGEVQPSKKVKKEKKNNVQEG